jgi:hypothetical protein
LNILDAKFYTKPFHLLLTFVEKEWWYALQEGKGKAIPLQALTDPEGSRRLRLPDFKTTGT